MVARAASGMSERTRSVDSAKRDLAWPGLGAWLRWVVRLPASVGSRGVRVSSCWSSSRSSPLAGVGEPCEACKGEGGGATGEDEFEAGNMLAGVLAQVGEPEDAEGEDAVDGGE